MTEREQTTDIGYAKQKQYGAVGARRHSVKRDEHGRWVTLCTGKPSTREYKGWVRTVGCQACLKALGAEGEGEDESCE